MNSDSNLPSTSRFRSPGAKYLVLAIASCISLLLSLAVLEGALRLGGLLLTRNRQSETQTMPWPSFRKDKEVISVLALGDSFTFGGMGPSRESYPSQLARLLARQHPNLFNITNNGVCEFTSRNIRNSLPDAIPLNRPDIILLLVGAANLYDPYPFADDLAPLYARYDNHIRRMRTYKLIRYCYFETATWIERNRMKARPHFDYDLSYPYKDILALCKMNIAQLRRQTAALEEKTARHGQPPPHDMWLLAEAHCLLKNYNRSLYYFERLLGMAPDAERQDQIMRSIMYGCLYNYESLDKPTETDKMNRDLLALEVGYPEDVRFFIAPLIRRYSRDSELNPQRAIDAIDYLTTKRPRFYRNKRLAAARLVFSDMKVWRDHVGIWFEDDLRHIIKAASDDNSRLVLQTYPVPYEPINTIVRRLSQEMDLPLADHERIFKPLIAKHREQYIKDDGHCTTLGHEIMARNILHVLEKAFLSRPKSLSDLRSHYAWH